MLTSPSGAFDTAVLQGGQVYVSVDLLNNTVAPPVTVGFVDLGLAEALKNSSVRWDRDSQVLRTCTLELPRADEFGSFFSKANFGITSGEWRINRGFVIGGVPQYVPLGIFHTKTYEEEKRGQGRWVRITGEDRSATCRKARFKRPYTINTGTLYPTAISGLVNYAVRGMFAYNSFLGANIDPTPRLVFSETENPWEKAEELATSISTRIFFDATGRFTFVGLGEDFLAVGPVFTLQTGASGGVLAPEVLTQDLDETINGAIVRGNAPWLLFPVIGEAWDDNPASPLRRTGPLGEMPHVIENGIVATQAQADSMAYNLFNSKRGVTEYLKFDHLVIPGLEPGDIISFIDTAFGLSSVQYIVMSADVPLSYDRAMSISAKRRLLP